MYEDWLDGFLQKYEAGEKPPPRVVPPPTERPKPPVGVFMNRFLQKYETGPPTPPRPMSSHGPAADPEWAEEGIFLVNRRTGERKLKPIPGGEQTVGLPPGPPDPAIRIEPGSLRNMLQEFAVNAEANMQQDSAGPPISPRSAAELDAAIAHDQALTDPRYVTGPLEGERYWSPRPGLNQAPDDVDLGATKSPLIKVDPETGMAYASPPFAEEGKSGVNYADWATAEGMTEPGFREDIVNLKPGARQTQVVEPQGLPTDQATPERLYGGDGGLLQALADAFLRRGSANLAGSTGGFLESLGRRISPPPEVARPGNRGAEMAAALGMDLGSRPIEPPLEPIADQLVETGQEMQEAAQLVQEEFPRPEYAQDFWKGMKTDPFKTLAISSLENLPNLLVTLGAATINPALGVGTAYVQEQGAAYQEAKASGATEEEAQTVAGVVGVTNMFLEYLPAGKLLKGLKGSTKEAQSSLMKQLVGQALAEGGTESVQEINQVIVQALGVAKAEGLSAAEIGARVAEAGLSGLVLGGGLGGVAGGARKLQGAIQTPDVEAAPAMGTERFEELNQKLGELRQARAKTEPPVRPDTEQVERRVNAALRAEVDSLLPALRDLPEPALRAIQDDPPNEAMERAVERVVFERASGTKYGPAENAPQVPESMAKRKEGEPLEVISDAPGLSARTPRWASTPEEGFTKLGDMVIANRGKILSPEDLPFEIDRLPLIRWEDSPGAVSEERGAHFWLIGDRTSYHNYGSGVGGNYPRAATLSPKNPLIVARPKLGTTKMGSLAEAEGRFLRDAAQRGHDAVIFAMANGDIEVATFPGTDLEPRPLAKATVGNLLLRGLSPKTLRGIGVEPPAEAVLGLAERVINSGTWNDLFFYSSPEEVQSRAPEDLNRLDEDVATSREIDLRDVKKWRSFLQSIGNPQRESLAAMFGIEQPGPQRSRREAARVVRAEDAGTRIIPEEGSGNAAREPATPGAEPVRASARPVEAPEVAPEDAEPGGEERSTEARRSGQTDEGVAGERTPEQQVLDLAQELGRRPKVPEIQHRLGVGYAQASRLWKTTSNWQAASAPGSLPAARELTAPAGQPAITQPTDVPDESRTEPQPKALPSLAARPEESGFAAIPQDTGRTILKGIRRNFTAAGLKPKWLLERVSNRNGRLAAHADRIGRLSRDLARAVHDYKGSLSRPQLLRYLDDAYRGMNLRTGGEALDARQIKRIAGRAGLPESEVATQTARVAPEARAGLRAAPEFLPIIRQMRAETDGLSRELRRAGLLDDTFARELERSYGLYSHRQYESIRNPRWNARVKRDPLWKRAFELTARKWETDANRDRAAQVAKELKLARKPEPGPVRVGDRVLVPDNPAGKQTGVAAGPAEEAGKIIVAHSFDEGDFTVVDPAKVRKQRGTREQAARDVHQWLRGYQTLTALAAAYGVSEQQIQDAYAGAYSSIPPKTEDEILGLMDSYLDRTGNRPSLPGGMPEGAKDLSALRRRDRQDDLRRNLMGEIRNVQSSFMTTALKIASLVEQQRFLEDIARVGRGDIFYEKPVRKGEESYSKPIDPDKILKSRETAKGEEPGIDELSIKKGKGRTSPLSGLFTSQDILDELTDVFDAKNYHPALRIWMTASFAAKAAATIGSVQSGNRNFLSNFVYVMAHGVNPLNPKRFRTSGARAYGRIFQHLNSRQMRAAERAIEKVYGGRPEPEIAREVQRRLELGLYDQSADVGDLKRLEKRSLLFKGEQEGAGSAGGKVVKTAGNWYQSHDNFAKDFVFEGMVPEYQDALGGTREEAEEYVAQRLRNSMQNYSRVPRAPRAVASLPFLPGPFLSFYSEVFRNSKNLVKWTAEELGSDNPKLRKLGRKKLAGMTGALAMPVVASFAARWWLGMDDDDDEAVRKFMAPWNRNSQIMFLDKGDEDVTFVDWGFMDAFAILKEPLLRLWNGDLQGAVESLGRPLSEDLLTQKVVDILRNTTETGTRVYNPRETFPRRQGAKVLHVAKALEPGASRSARRIADPERKTWAEVLALLGPRITTVNVPKELTRRAKQYKVDTSEDLWIEKSVIYQKGTEGKKERAAERAERQLRESVAWIIELTGAARQLGIGEDAIAESLAGGNLAEWEAEMVSQGNIEGIVERYKENLDKWKEKREEEQEEEARP